MKQAPTEGELYLINFLKENLDDRFEIYFQPFLNGYMPDIVLVRKGSGIYIIEVKDWDLDKYNVDAEGNWFVKSENQQIYSPELQAEKYKQACFDIHIEGLLSKSYSNRNYYSIIHCGVFFYKTSNATLNKIKRNNKYTDYFGVDIDKEKFLSILQSHRFLNSSKLFDDDIYQKFKRYLRPPIHRIEEGANIIFSDEQKKIIDSYPNKRQKVRGVPGSGKTLCLAKRAVNAHLRHGQEVLIIFNNITLRNYIHDQINKMRENFGWSYFHIIWYHDWILSKANQLGIEVHDSLRFCDDESLFKGYENELTKYKTIIIDEIQDFKKEWVNIMLKYFLDEDGEYVVFGDEKQNLYGRPLDEERRPYTKIGGNWNLLKESYRVKNSIARLCELFQREFLISKYDCDSIEVKPQQLSLSFVADPVLRYYSVNVNDQKKIWTIVDRTRNELSIHDNDICILMYSITEIRELEYYIRTNSISKPITMCETKEDYDKLVSMSGPEYIESSKDSVNDMKLLIKKLKLEVTLNKMRKSQKIHFYENSGRMKMSTIHSYKGREVDTLFLIIGNKNEGQSTPPEFIYTAISRCRTNLIVINTGETQYDTFFSENTDNCQV